MTPCPLSLNRSFSIRAISGVSLTFVSSPTVSGRPARITLTVAVMFSTLKSMPMCSSSCGSSAASVWCRRRSKLA
ncbi:Uncharacterised protein [Bordetella pertussis]|nr:Uncharacterised protein [Bordetella pertussis]